MKKFLIFCVAIAVLSCVNYWLLQSSIYIQPISSQTYSTVSFLATESDKSISDSDENGATTFLGKLSMWCTKNADFISLLELIVSIFTAGITFLLTIKIANLPYVKKIYFWSHNEKSQGKYKVFITVINSGHQAIRIDKIEIYCKKKLLGEHIELKSSRDYLGVGSSQEFVVTLCDFEEAICTDEKMRIIIHDIQGKKYKFTSGFQLG